jgi:hypothetical protein
MRPPGGVAGGLLPGGVAPRGRGFPGGGCPGAAWPGALSGSDVGVSGVVDDPTLQADTDIAPRAAAARITYSRFLRFIDVPPHEATRPGPDSSIRDSYERREGFLPGDGEDCVTSARNAGLAGRPLNTRQPPVAKVTHIAGAAVLPPPGNVRCVR